VDGLAKQAFIGHYNMPWNAKYRNDFDTISVAKEDPLNQKYQPQIEQHPIGSPERNNLNAQRDTEWDQFDKQRKKDAWNVKKSVTQDKDLLRSPAAIQEMAMRRMDQVNAIKVEAPKLFPQASQPVVPPKAPSSPKVETPKPVETPKVAPEVKQSTETPKTPPKAEMPKPVETPKVAPAATTTEVPKVTSTVPPETPKVKFPKMKVGAGLAGAAIGAGVVGASLFGKKKNDRQQQNKVAKEMDDVEGLAKVASGLGDQKKVNKLFDQFDAFHDRYTNPNHLDNAAKEKATKNKKLFGGAAAAGAGVGLAGTAYAVKKKNDQKGEE
jgi:hypothetical protein